MEELSKNQERRIESPRDIVPVLKNSKDLLTEWEQAQLCAALRKGPGTDPESWGATLKNLVRLRDHQPWVLRSLVSDPIFEKAGNEGWTDGEFNRFSELVKKAFDCDAAFETSGSQEDLEALAAAVHETLVAQGLPDRSEEEVLGDYLTAGRVLRTEGEWTWFQDMYGREVFMVGAFVPDLSPPEMVDSEENRPFEHGHCVRLTTDAYTGIGLPKGSVGYVLQLVSNKSFTDARNYCEVAFIVGYDAEDQSCTDEYLEVTDSELELCDKDHRPPAWFPFEVGGDGFVKKTRKGQFQLRPNPEPYTYEELEDQEILGAGPIEGPSQPSSLIEEAAEGGQLQRMTSFITSAPDDTLSSRIGIETRASDGPEKGKHPVWIRYEPRFGPWVTIALGDQLLATHRFERFGIKEWQIGEVTEIEDSGHLIVGFHPDAPSYYPNEPELDTNINQNEPEPYWSSPFVLLGSSLKRRLPPLGTRDEERTRDLYRRGEHLFNLLPRKEEAGFEETR